MTKKFATIFLVTTLFLIFAGQAWASSSELVIDGRSITKDMTVQVLFNKPFISLKYITEKMGGQYSWNEKTKQATVKYNGSIFTVDNGAPFITVNGVHRWVDFPAYIWDKDFMVSLFTVNKIFDVDGAYSSEKSIITITSKKPELNSVKIISNSGGTQVLLTGNKPLEVSTQSANQEIIVDLDNVINKTGKEIIEGNSNGVKNVSISYSALHNKTRVVIALQKPMNYHLEKTSDPKQLILNLSEGVSNNNQPSTPSGKAKLLEISLDSLPEMDQFHFSLQGQTSPPNIQKLSGPGRLVLDFDNTTLGSMEKSLPVNDEYVKQVRSAQFSPEVTRVVLDLNKDIKYRFLPNGSSSSFLLQIAKTPNPNWGGASLAGKTIVIDPGHGGKDPGAIGPSGIREKDVVLPVAQNLYQRLVAAGANPILTRSTDEFIDLVPRADLANRNNADLFLSVHANSASAAAAKGIEVYSYINATSPEGSKLAKSVQKNLVKNLGSYDRGTHTANFSVLRNSKMPSALAELGFISNPQEEKLLNDPSFQQKAADALFQGILGYYQE